MSQTSMLRLRATQRVLCGTLLATLALACWPATGMADTTTYNLVGQYSWTVPARVFSATFDVYGAQGAAGYTGGGGRGGRATVTIAVSPGQTFSLNVGGTGGANGAGGANGGAQGGGPSGNGGGGGGASDVRTAPFGLAQRLVVAGGGGGGGNSSSGGTLSNGGSGGGTTGDAGSLQGGQGGTQDSAGAGAGGAGGGDVAVGGAGTCSGFQCGGGGGGGWYGGGGGLDGGGGGSGHGPDGVTLQSGTRLGNGQIVIAYIVTPGPPVAVTGTASDITQTDAILGGSTNANATPTTYHFEYGTTATYGSSTPEVDAGSEGVPRDRIQAVSGLAPNTAYHFRIVATSGTGTSAGTDAVFQTGGQSAPPPKELPGKPAATTAPATDIGQHAALLHGALHPQGTETAYHFEYGPTTAYGRRTASIKVAGNAIQLVTEPLAALELGKGVHFRLVATNAGGTTAGADAVFATLGRMKPISVTSKVGGRDRAFPHTYAVTGRIALPQGVSRSDGCKGTVTVLVKNAKKTILVRRAAVAKDCTYSQKLTLKVQSRLRGARGRLRVAARFAGNEALLARNAREAVALFGTP